MDEADVDEADLVVVRDALGRLRSEEGLSAKEEQKIWQTVKDRGGSALTSGPVKRVLEGLVSAVIRSQMGL